MGKVIFIIIAILLALILIKFVLWLIPIILVAILAYYIYQNLVKKNKDIIKKKR